MRLKEDEYFVLSLLLDYFSLRPDLRTDLDKQYRYANMNAYNFVALSDKLRLHVAKMKV